MRRRRGPCKRWTTTVDHMLCGPQGGAYAGRDAMEDTRCALCGTTGKVRPTKC
jgi:hypothetical protein